MRVFIAIELPREIREKLSQNQAQLKITGADVKWVEPQNIHLTLKFLGEIDEKILPQIIGILEDIAKTHKAFVMRLSSIGAFPKPSSPRVIWAGVDKGDLETKELAKILEEKLKNFGIPAEDRPFSSHITIGRTRTGLNIRNLVQGLNNLLNNFAGKNQEFAVGKITLFKSTLTPKGPIYEILKEAVLASI